MLGTLPLEMIEFIASKNLVFAAETKINRSIFFTHPKTKQQSHMRAEEIIPLIKQFYAHRLKHVEILQQNGKTKHVFTYTFKSKLKDCSTPLQIFFIFDKWSETDDKDIHVLITNNPAMSGLHPCLLSKNKAIAETLKIKSQRLIQHLEN